MNNIINKTENKLKEILVSIKIKKSISTIVLAFISISAISQSKCLSGDCKNGWGKYVYSNGDYYVGNWKENKRDGFGYYCFTKDDIYRTGYYTNDNMVWGYHVENSIGGYGLYYGSFYNGNANGIGYRIPFKKERALLGYLHSNGKVISKNNIMNFDYNNVGANYQNIIDESKRLQNYIDTNLKRNQFKNIKNSYNLYNLSYDSKKEDYSNMFKIHDLNYLKNNGKYYIENPNYPNEVYGTIIPTKFGYTIPQFSIINSVPLEFVELNTELTKIVKYSPWFTSQGLFFNSIYSKSFDGDANTIRGDILRFQLNCKPKTYKKINNNLFLENGFFIHNDNTNLDSFIFLDYTFRYDDYISCVPTILDRGYLNNSFEIKEQGNIKTYKQISKQYVGNSNKHYFFSFSKSHLTYDNSKVYLDIYRKNFYENTNYRHNLYSINDILKKYASEKSKAYFNNTTLEKKFSNWSIKEAIQLKNENVVVFIDLKETFFRHEKAFPVPVEHEFSKTIAILVNKYGTEILSTDIVPNCDEFIPSKKGGFFGVIDNGIYTYYYDSNLTNIWSKSYGLTKNKKLPNDKFRAHLETESSLYISLTTQNYGYLGKNNSRVIKIDTNTGDLSKEVNFKGGAPISSFLEMNNEIFYLQSNRLLKLNE